MFGLFEEVLGLVELLEEVLEVLERVLCLEVRESLEVLEGLEVDLSITKLLWTFTRGSEKIGFELVVPRIE